MQLASQVKAYILESLVFFDLFWQELKRNYLYRYMERERERARDSPPPPPRTDFSQQLNQNLLFLLQVFFKWRSNRSCVLVLQLPYVSLGACG